MAESRITALATLGNLSRGFTECASMCAAICWRRHDAQRRAASAAFDDDEQDVVRLLPPYADSLVLGDRERRLLGEYQTLSREWITDAKQAMPLVNEGRAAEAVALLNGRVSELGFKPQWGVERVDRARPGGGHGRRPGIARGHRSVSAATC